MAFEFPEGLAPEVFPLAWLVGHWRGTGEISYPGVGKHEVVHDLVVDHDGGPYLRFESTLRVLDAEVPDEVPADDAWPAPVGDTPAAGAAGAGTVWSTETGYWRISTQRPEGMDEGAHPVEVLVADASGRMSASYGQVGNGRIDIATDAVYRTETAANVGASKRMYGLVEGKLLWVEELAAFGNPLGNYASATLDRL